MPTDRPSSESSRRPSPSSRWSRPNNGLFRRPGHSGWAALLWGLAAALALLWPSRLIGSLDGIPLDRPGEAILVGVVFPALWWAFPRFLASRVARALVLALLASKIVVGTSVVQEGWCERFVPAGPIVKNETGAPHSWDLRADWLSPDPACSAIVSRAYEGIGDFPAWFFNLPPPTDSWPKPEERPPAATTRLTVRGFIDARQPGTLKVETGRDMTSAVVVDGRAVAVADDRTATAALGPGVHAVNIDATLEGTRWRLIPTWNGVDLWSTSTATIKRPSRIDRLVRPWGGALITLLAAALLGSWLVTAIATIGDVVVLAWMAIACGWLAALAATGHVDAVRWSIPLLAAASCLRVAPRLRNARGAFLLLGVPWLVVFVVLSIGEVGRFRLYEVGNDFWTFQRAAYRIVMQGYWLEGGSPTFWFQPLYRWFAGLLHVVFGDSSVGEVYWDAGWLLVSALFGFVAVRAFAGFRWGLAAAALTLAVHAVGNSWPYVGRGLSEITSAGLLYLAAAVVLRSRGPRLRFAVIGGLAAALGFYTRLNNLPMAFAAALFALPQRMPACALLRPRRWLIRTRLAAAGTVVGIVALAIVLFAWRTWHYTGVFSFTYGTQAKLLAVWQPGMSMGAAIRAMGDSVMMVLTMNDPPRFDWRALPLLGGMAIAVLAIAGVPRLRELPLALVLFALASIAGALVARGSAYPGRFSIHVIPVTCALVVCALRELTRGARIAGPERAGSTAPS